MKTLICNAGSSSIKFSVIDAENESLLAEGEINWIGQRSLLRVQHHPGPEMRKERYAQNHSHAIAEVLSELRSAAPPPPAIGRDFAAVGHRIVHGGEAFTSARIVNDEVKIGIRNLAELAPLHNALSLEVIAAVSQELPAVPQIVSFDTAFHSTLDAAARIYPVPHRWVSDWHVRRYGFHGLSHSYCTTRAAELLVTDRLRLIVAHLGNGASISAVCNGRCVDTSMGFTPLDGLMMGTRSGSIDPGILIYLLRHQGFTADQLDHALNHESGLLGISGVSSDVRQVIAAAERRDPQAQLAIDMYVRRMQQTIGAMAAMLGGVDALIFTAGAGEHSPPIRERVCERLKHLGLELDPRANAECKPDADIATPASVGRILVIATREDLMIARDIRRLLRPSPNSRSFQ